MKSLIGWHRIYDVLTEMLFDVNVSVCSKPYPFLKFIDHSVRIGSTKQSHSFVHTQNGAAMAIIIYTWNCFVGISIRVLLSRGENICVLVFDESVWDGVGMLWEFVGCNAFRFVRRLAYSELKKSLLILLYRYACISRNDLQSTTYYSASSLMRIIVHCTFRFIHRTEESSDFGLIDDDSSIIV